MNLWSLINRSVDVDESMCVCIYVYASWRVRTDNDSLERSPPGGMRMLWWWIRRSSASVSRNARPRRAPGSRASSPRSCSTCVCRAPCRRWCWSGSCGLSSGTNRAAIDTTTSPPFPWRSWSSGCTGWGWWHCWWAGWRSPPTSLSFLHNKYNVNTKPSSETTESLTS